MEREIRSRIAAAKSAETPGDWITYLIRDPRLADKKGNPAGWPIYVGQTDEFGNRVRNHLRKSEKAARLGTGIKPRIKSLLHAGVVPNFEVLDRQPTRLRSLLSETNFARLCRNRGYDIANATTLQNRAGEAVTISDLPSKWLWNFTLSQAIDDALQLELSCVDCKTTIGLPLTVFDASPLKTLRQIRDHKMWDEQPCGSCGALSTRKVRVRVGPR